MIPPCAAASRHSNQSIQLESNEICPNYHVSFCLLRSYSQMDQSSRPISHSKWYIIHK